MPTKSTNEGVIQEIKRLFAERGDSMYAGEPITQSEHALQCTWLAESQGTGEALIVASLLHDVGHLMHDLDENCSERGIDDQHELLGQRWLESVFADPVSQPVGLHVMAKRYRCHADETYWLRLSSASQRSLMLQGGPLTRQQAEQFRAHPYFHDAVKLRIWDESAKVPGTKTPPLEHFLQFVENQLEWTS